MTVTRTSRIEYGGWASNDTGWQLHGVHLVDEDQDALSVEATAVVTAATEAALLTRVNAFLAEINTENQAVLVVMGGQTFTDLDPASGTWEAQSTRAEVDLIGSHRTAKSRAYRVTLSVAKNAAQTGKTGKRSQSYSISQSPSGVRTVSASVTFTPSEGIGSALDVFNHATHGFTKTATDFLAALDNTVTWEAIRKPSYRQEADARDLTGSATYREVIFAQSKDATNDVRLVGADYDVVVNRESAFGAPGQTSVGALTSVTVLFRSGVDKAQSTDLSAVIDDVVLPYVKDTVSQVLRLEDDPVTINHTLRADPVGNSISGQVYFLVAEYQTLELSIRYADVGSVGDALVPVLNGTRWTRDLHEGPGSWTRRLVIGARVVGTDLSQLDQIEQQERERIEGNGFHFTGWSESTSPTVEVFQEGDGALTTTVQLRSLEFQRADLRQSGTQTRSRVEDENGYGAERLPTGEA